MEIPDENRTFVATAGSFVFIPKGTVHTYKNVGAQPPKMLAIATPAGFEGFLEEVGQPAGEGAVPPPGPEELERALAAAPKYDIDWPLRKSSSRRGP